MATTGLSSGYPGYEIREFAFEGAQVRYHEGGKGPPILLVHGVGPGTSSGLTYRFLLEPLAKHFHVFAMDLVGFGISGRKPAEPYFDFDFWTRQVHAMIGRMPAGKVDILGHSLSGALSLRVASANPRVASVLTTGTVGTEYRLTSHLETLWTFPGSREALRGILGRIMHDVSQITDRMLDDRLKVLNEGDYPAYFSSMFGPDKQALMDSWVLSPEELGKVTCPVTLIHGRNDLPCPAEETTLKLAPHLPQADVVLLAKCSHSPAVEYPEKVLAQVVALFGKR